MPLLDFQFLKDRYNFELQRKEQITASVNLPVGVLGGLGGLLALMGRSFTYSDPVLAWVFVPCLIAAVLAFFCCLVQLARAYHRQTYIYLPLLTELEKARVAFREFESMVGGEESEDAETFDASFRRRIIDAADQNTFNNDERSSLLYWARVWLFVVLWFAAAAGIPYVSDQVRGRFHAQRRSPTADTTPGTATEYDARAATVSTESNNPRGRSSSTTATPTETVS